MPKKCLFLTILSLIIFYPENIFGRDEEGSRCRPEGVFAPNPSDCNSFLMCNHGKYILRPCQVENIYYFLFKFAMKPHIDLVEIIIFSLYHVIIRPTKIISNLLKVRKLLIFKFNFHCWKSMESFWKTISLRNIRLGDQCILIKFFGNLFFSENVPNFCQLCS